MACAWDRFNVSRQDGTIKRTLYDSDGKSIGTVELEARYIPVPVKLEPRESVNSERDTCLSRIPLKPLSDQGILQVQLLDGGEIHGADRGGVLSLHEPCLSWLTLSI